MLFPYIIYPHMFYASHGKIMRVQRSTIFYQLYPHVIAG